MQKWVVSGLVEFREIVLVVMAVDLLLVYDPLGNRLFRDLSLVYFHFHGAKRDESVNVAGLGLPKPVHPVDALNIVRRIPRNVENDHSVRCHQIYA